MDIIRAREELILGKTIYDMKLRVVDYGRVSTDKDEQLNSLGNQINYFRDMVEGVKNWKHVCSYSDEGISGTQVYKRENFLRMIEDARLGKFDLILTKEVSRFARNTIDSIRYTQLLLNYGVIVFFISDNINTVYPDSEFRLTLMASMAQDEVRKLSERVKFGIKRSIRDGKVGGGGLYGYIKDKGSLVINENEAPAVRMLFSLYASGEYGFRRIGEILAKKGYYTRKGKVFSDVTLKKMLTNLRYKGYYTAGMSEVVDYKTHKRIIKDQSQWVVYRDDKGIVPSIVKEEVWDKANEVYRLRNSNKEKFVFNKEDYLLNRKYTSKLICKEHKVAFIRSASGKRRNNPVWQCNEFLRHGVKGCLTVRLYERDLDNLFSYLIEKLFENRNEVFREIVKDYRELVDENSEISNIEEIERKIVKEKMIEEELLELYLEKVITKEEFKKRKEKNELEIEKLKKELDGSEGGVNNDEVMKKIFNEVQARLDIKNNIGKYFNLFIDRVLVSKIDNDRKKARLEISYNFKCLDEIVELDLRKLVNK